MPMPSRIHFEFLKANLAALFAGRLFVRGGHLPPAGHKVPQDFAGVGVATAADPATDAAVIDQLQALGLRRVRLDFSYGDASNHVGRFLDALCEQGLDVMLHLVQPADAARRMPGASARAEWQAFVTDTLTRVAGRVSVIEFGSTINRKRWAGYTLDGFLAAWGIAWDEARSRGFVIAGPSVTDFEPPWNIGILALLRARGQLPDIHTDNLFAERSTEPERWDHKILGRPAAPLLRMNLVHKARLLARIGADAGVPRFVSPSAFWTLPRIERVLPDSEQKQADYLARYMILCAASGALEAAFWGPLVCHREGLVDDGPQPYPKLERITHYAALTGSLAALRRRPAFDAMAAFNRLIPGNTYTGRLNAGQGLEMHGFDCGAHRIHAVWTVNGGAAAACDLYPPGTLEAAQWLDRDGLPLAEIPSVITESPIYLRWPADLAVAVLKGAAPLKDVTIHHHGGLAHYYHRDADWHGMVRASNRSEADALIAALHPDTIGAPAAKADSLRHARNVIWTVEDPRTPDARLVVKKPVRHHLHKKLLDRLKPSKARRSWNGAAELQRRGVNTATPVAWFEQRSGSDLTRNWYVCEFVDGGLSAGGLFAAHAQGEDMGSGIGVETLFADLADFLARMHNRGIFFRDLSGGNILVRRADQGLDFRLIDTGRIHTFPGGLPMRVRLADLVRASHKLNPQGRKRLLELYLAAIGRKPSSSHRWPFLVYDAKVALKRKIGRKAWKRWLQRLRGKTEN